MAVAPAPPPETSAYANAADQSTEEIECEVAIALFDYDGPDEGDLSFKEGETIYIQEKIDEGWWRGYNSKDEFGLLPSNFVRLQTTS